MTTGWKTLTIPAKLHREIKRAAVDSGDTMGDIVVAALVTWLEARRAECREGECAPYRPFLGCGWDDPADGTCAHPRNQTSECHQHCCPIRPAAPGREEPPHD